MDRINDYIRNTELADKIKNEQTLEDVINNLKNINDFSYMDFFDEIIVAFEDFETNHQDLSGDSSQIEITDISIMDIVKGDNKVSAYVDNRNSTEIKIEFEARINGELINTLDIEDTSEIHAEDIILSVTDVSYADSRITREWEYEGLFIQEDSRRDAYLVYDEGGSFLGTIYSEDRAEHEMFAKLFRSEINPIENEWIINGNQEFNMNGWEDNTNTLREYENNVKIFVVEYNDDGHNGFHEVFNTLKEANEFAKNEYLENQKKYDNIETAYVNVFSMDEGVYNAYFTTGELDGNFDDFAHFTDDMFNSKYPSEIEHSKVVSKENYEAIQEAIEILKGIDALTAKDVFDSLNTSFTDVSRPNITEVISRVFDGVDLKIDIPDPEWYKEAREEATNQGIDINDVLDEFYPDEMDYTDDEEYMLPIIEDALKYEEYSISYPKKDSSDWIDAEDINREIIDELSDVGVEMTDDEFNAGYDRESLINFLSKFKAEDSKEMSLEVSDFIEEKLDLLEAIEEINADDVLRGISIHEHGNASNNIYLRSEVPFLLDDDEAPTDRRIQITDIVIPRDYTLEDIKEKPQILKQTIENRLNNGDFDIAYPDFDDDYEHFHDISSEILNSLSDMGVEIDKRDLNKYFNRETLIKYINEFKQVDIKQEVSKVMKYEDVEKNLMDIQDIDSNEFEDYIVAGFEDFEARDNGYNTVIIEKKDENEFEAHTDHECATKFLIRFTEDKENETISVDQVYSEIPRNREWKIDDLSIVENLSLIENDNTESLKVYDKNDRYLGSIYPEYDMDDCIAALFRDENPIEAGWEDGNGNSLSYEGWGDGLTSYYFDEIASNSEMTIFEIVENIRDVVNPPISVNCELEKKEGNLATLSVESEAVDLNGEPKFKASFELEERNDTYKITSWNVENESMKNLYVSEVNNYEHIKDIEDIDLFIDKESIGIDESGITYIKDEKEFSKIEELASILKDVDETFEKHPTNERIQALREDKDKAIKKGSLDDVKKVKEKIDVELNPEKETKKKVHER